MAKSRSQSKAAHSRNEEHLDKNDNNLKTKITFGFDFFLGTDLKGNGQDWDDWMKDDLIIPMLKKLAHLSTLTPAEAKKEESLKIYGAFPCCSEFKCPPHLSHIDSWGTIRKMGSGWKRRIAGFYDKDYVFRLVFLDKEHKFWPTD
ncbi:hypothetical protein ACSS1H_00610 [Acinetobacter baumannii]|uniref:hypothetical protein n=1 Tax=Acinetobacter baumannii TaxID=470 RepID=UPI002940C4EC|nr:hypothetical protein [Acinetobacter baumannii]MDV4292698.1 hypothetical protein [Acinetobacter baumannii]